MSDYKIVKDAAGKLICYGPNTDSYEPILKTGETLTIETKAVADVLIKDYEMQVKTISDKAATDRAALLTRLGITDAEAKLL